MPYAPRTFGSELRHVSPPRMISAPTRRSPPNKPLPNRPSPVTLVKRIGSQGDKGTWWRARCRLGVRPAFLAILLGALISTARAHDPGTDGLRVALRPTGRVCDRRIRLSLIITNVGRNAIWLAFDKPGSRLDGVSTSYCDTSGCESITKILCWADEMSFLRSDEAVRLNAGQSATWSVHLDPLHLRPGNATVEASVRVASSRDLSKQQPDRAVVRVAARLKLVRDGRCFNVLPAG
jgi:hypothetical protein